MVTTSPRSPLALLAGLCLLSATSGCPDHAARERRDQRRQLTAGHRSHSAARRTAAERPRGWQEDKSPHEADRTGVAGYRAERQARGGADPGVPTTSTRCLQVLDRYACPLLAHRWQAADVTRGVRLEAEASPAEAGRLREFVHCHEAYARHDRRDQSCLRQFAPLRASGGYRKGRVWLELRAGRPDGVNRLRRGVRALIAEAL